MNQKVCKGDYNDLVLNENDIIYLQRCYCDEMIITLLFLALCNCVSKKTHILLRYY